MFIIILVFIQTLSHNKYMYGILLVRVLASMKDSCLPFYPNFAYSTHCPIFSPLCRRVMEEVQTGAKGETTVEKMRIWRKTNQNLPAKLAQDSQRGPCCLQVSAPVMVKHFSTSMLIAHWPLVDVQYQPFLGNIPTAQCCLSDSFSTKNGHKI